MSVCWALVSALRFSGKHDKPDPALMENITYWNKGVTPRSLRAQINTLYSSIQQIKRMSLATFSEKGELSSLLKGHRTHEYSHYFLEDRKISCSGVLHVFFLKARKNWLEQAGWVLRLPTPLEFPRPFPHWPACPLDQISWTRGQSPT